MPDHPKKHGFLGRISRIFTRKDHDAYDAIPFREPEQAGDETWPALECPEGWSAEAAEILNSEAACHSIPARTRAIEENTVPSWLWRRVAAGSARTEEFSTKQIFDRVAGSAAYAGWKLGLFHDETDARIFFDEVRAMLMQRLVAFEPRALATLGLDWAYDITENASRTAPKSAPRSFDISNASIDAIVRGIADKTLRAKWQKMWAVQAGVAPVTLRLSDIADDWGKSSSSAAPRAVLDLAAFRHADGWVNIDALRHAVRLTTILLDLHGDTRGGTLEIGFCNLAPLLISLALPYDSDGGRSVAAALSAIVTAEAYAASAELAGLRGPGADFVANRETVLRILRNHRRAAYGDRNDYEKISVLPVPLTLEHSPDLALVAAAQRRWEDVIDLVRKHGLRHTQVTSLGASPELTMFTETAAQGIAPVASLMVLRPTESGLFRKEVNPAVPEALTRLGYDKTASRNVLRHLTGAGSLEKAPAINHASLRAHGFDDAALERVTEYLPNVNDIRLAFTPWVVGEQFCRKALKISDAKIRNPRFELLRHLGFTEAQIDGANAYCYGHETLRGAKDLRQPHAAIFARADEISPEARIRMAAAVQGFISGDTELDLSLAAGTPAETSEFLLLTAWRQGVKSVSMSYDAKAPVAKKAGKRIKSSAFMHMQPPTPLPPRGVRPKAGSGLVSLSRGKVKSSGFVRGKRS